MTCSRLAVLVLFVFLVGTAFTPALADLQAFDPDGLLRQQQQSFPGDVVMAGSPHPPVEYLIVCPAGFTWQIAIAPLVNFHLSRGTRTGVRFLPRPVSREDVRTVIREEFERGSGILRYVLLVGDANEHEYPSYWGCPCQTQHDIIPMAEYISKDDIWEGGFSRWSHYIPTDWPYVDFDSDDLPDIALGRFPVRHPGELTLTIEKTLEAARRIESGGEFLNHVGVWCQDQDGNGNSGYLAALDADQIVASMPGQLIVDRLNKSELKTYENGEREAIAALRQGRGVVLSTGTACSTYNWHGFLDTRRGFRWTNPRLRMGGSPLLPFALAPGADLGNIDQTESKHAPHLGGGRPMMEEALLTPYAGPWATFSPTRGSPGYGVMLSIIEFLRMAYVVGTPSAGWAAAATVTNVSLQDSRFRDYVRSLIFLGDPALPLPDQVISPADVKPAPPVPDQSYLSLRSPNPSRGDVSLEYGISERAHVRVSVFDIRGRRVGELVNDVKEPGEYTTRWTFQTGRSLETGSGVYFVQLVVAGSVRGSAKVVRLP